MKETKLEVQESGAIEETCVTFSTQVYWLSKSVYKLTDAKCDSFGKTGFELVCSLFNF